MNLNGHLSNQATIAQSQSTQLLLAAAAFPTFKIIFCWVDKMAKLAKRPSTALYIGCKYDRFFLSLKFLKET